MLVRLYLLRETLDELVDKFNGNVDAFLSDLNIRRNKWNQLNEKFGNSGFSPFPTTILDEKELILNKVKEI